MDWSIPADAIPAMRTVDATIIVTSVAAVWFMLGSGIVRSRVTSSTGRWMILGGIVLLISHQTVEMVLKLIDPSEAFLENPTFVVTQTPAFLSWVLTRVAFVMLVGGLLIGLLRRRRSESVMASRQSDIIEAAQKSVLMLEARFRSLLGVTSNPSYCWAFEPPIQLPVTAEEFRQACFRAFLVECNEPFVRLHQAESAAELIGMRYTGDAFAKDVDAHRRMCAAFIEGDYRLTDYEVTFQSDEGPEHVRKVSVTGIVEDGRLLRIWGSDTDLREIQKTKSALDERRSFQDLVAGISSYMIMTPIERSSEIVEQCLRDVCEYISVDRSSLLWIDWEQETAFVNYHWASDEQKLPEQIPTNRFPFFRKLVRDGRVVKVADINDIEDEAKQDFGRLKVWGVRSFVALPLTVANEVVGLVSFGTSESAREWTDQDVLDLRVVAELFANFVSRLKSQSELSDALAALSVAKERLEAENVYLREEIQSTHSFDEIIGKSEPIMRSLRMVEMVAETDTPVLILGETGTGKELFARAIHERSARSGRPLVKVNCATLPASLIESELFGYEKGAFTGADARKRGRFDLAHGSTLFLDEFGELPLELQTKLLRVLQEGEFERLGGTETIQVDVRLIVATNRDLAEAVSNGTFRSDLFYRINTFPIQIPPLRERDGDVELLARHFAASSVQRLDREIQGISSNMMHQLVSYHWPGNVRELEGLIERAVISNTSDFLELPEPLSGVDADDYPPHRIISSTVADLHSVEREHILNILEESRWKISGQSGAASKLGLPPSTLRSKMKKLNIAKPR